MSSGDAPNIASKTILVVANETLGGQQLLDAVRERADSDTRFILCVPQNKPRAGLVVYNESVFDAAQVRLDLALEVIRDMGIRAIGEVGDQDPFTASKLNTGGGEETCHSSVSARHGFAGARGPPRQLETML